MATDAQDLLLPEGARLVHIGPHKTGTTGLQAALWSAREAMLAQGVRHVGRSRNPAAAVRSVTGQRTAYSDESPSIRPWVGLVKEITAAEQPRIILSSEQLAWAAPDVIRRIVDDLDPARIHVAVTLRPLGRLLPSLWQQRVQAGTTLSLDDWLRQSLSPVRSRANRAFWMVDRHDELIDRWAAIVGRDRLTAIVVDERDHAFLYRVFEQLLGLRDGTLVEVPDLTNRSLTLLEAEAIRAFNVAFKAEGLPRAIHGRAMHRGAAQLIKRWRRPAPHEPRVGLPGWARERVAEIEREMVDRVAASGVRVVGDLESLARGPGGPGREPQAEPMPPVVISPEIAAALAMGVLVSTGAARDAGDGRGRFEFAEPPELARVPTYQVAGVLGLRGLRSVRRTLRRAGDAFGTR